MKRVTTKKRANWEKRVSERGFPLHSSGGTYWDESAYYAFDAAEIDRIERATNAIHALTLEAVEHAITSGKYWDRLRVKADVVPLIVKSWEDCGGEGAPSIYGRLDLAYVGDGEPKLLEYNADTPTALIEAAVLQHDWKEDVRPDADQFNSIHERLVDGWRNLAPWLAPGVVHFASGSAAEDVLTATYMQDTAAQAGLSTAYIATTDIGFDGARFVDLENRPIRSCFKLYPWEWMLAEEFGAHLQKTDTTWIEPIWKRIVSNKAFLTILSELFPDHPNLLRTSLAPLSSSYAKKALFGREGADVTLVKDGAVVAEGHVAGYADAGFVYQELFDFAGGFDGNIPVVGSWLIQGESAGIGIREERGLITTNTSRFVPHSFQ